MFCVGTDRGHEHESHAINCVFCVGTDWGHEHESQEEAGDAHADCDGNRRHEVTKIVVHDCDGNTHEGCSGAQAQCDQDQEEQHREQLR